MRKGEYILTPMVAAGLFGAAPQVWWFLAGALLWTFIEYAVHRAVHTPSMWRSHHHHHAHPKEEPPAVFWPFWISLALLLAFLPLSLLGGLTAGYAWFIGVHHGCHFAREDVDPALLRHHDRHHHEFPNANFGVSTRLWDVLFGTAA